jgi:hypothetical protein
MMHDTKASRIAATTIGIAVISGVLIAFAALLAGLGPYADPTEVTAASTAAMEAMEKNCLAWGVFADYWADMRDQFSYLEAVREKRKRETAKQVPPIVQKLGDKILDALYADLTLSPETAQYRIEKSCMEHAGNPQPQSLSAKR